MKTLAVKLLGPLSADIDGQPVQGLKTNKVRALLAYLAIESDRPARRETLAGMFWPEFSERRARANLSQALFTLRHSIGDDSAAHPFLIVNRHTVQFTPDKRLWVDARAFADGVLANKRASTWTMIRQLETAVALYKSEFLDGFSLGGSPPFEMWCLTLRERLHRQMSDALTQLVDIYEREADYETALTYASHLVSMDSWREEAHVAMMRLLALCGRRSEALAQYETCRRVLLETLGIAPMRGTTALYHAVRDERSIASTLSRSAVPDQEAVLPDFLNVTAAALPPITCVSRQKELARLEHVLESAMAGHGRVVFVAGEAGSGKTILWQTFARQMMERHPQLLVASGKGTAYTGLGDPYATFRDIMSHLTGNVATQWAAGTMSRTQALRLWRALPFAIEALLRDAPALIGTFVDGANLLERAAEYARAARLNHRQMDWLSQLEALVAGGATAAGSAGQHQSALFAQFVCFLTTMARHSPLLLIVDDLQWADVGTIGLLFHISRNLAGQRLLLLGAFRPEEIAVMQDGRRHPLEPVVHEIQHEFGDIMLGLGQRADPSFVEAVLDSEPNNLDEAFRARLFKLTGGHPLYTAELLRGLQERGELLKDARGRWEIGSELDWDTIPPRVEGVIAERIGRLPLKSQRLLQAASVQGESFIAEITAQALEVDETEVAFALGNELSRDHHLVRAQRLERPRDGRGRLSTYQFHHFLFQKYLYDNLDPIDKARLHEITGEALALHFGDHASQMSVQLARHFEAAGLIDKAVDFRLQAGNYAIKLAANEEASKHFSRGLDLLDSLVETEGRARRELTLQLGLGTALQLKDGYGAAEAESAYSRARYLCDLVGDSPQLVSALWPLATYAAMVGDLPQAVDLAEQAVAVAHRSEDPLFVSVAYHHLGWISYHCGHFTESLAHQDESIALYDQQYHETMIRMFGHDFGVTSLGWSAWPLCFLGFPDTALLRCHEAIALAQSFDHPFSLVHAYTMTAHVHLLRGELARVAEFAERMIAIANAYGFATYIAAAPTYLGAGLIGKGYFAQGIAQMRTSLDYFETGGVKLYHRGTLVLMAEALTQLGRIEEAQTVLAEADTIGYRDHSDALLEDVRGQILAVQGCPSEEVEACFLRAIRIAQGQQAKWLELQVTMSLCRLWQAQGRQREGLERLTAVYDWFTEGFDTPILKAASALLAELA